MSYNEFDVLHVCFEQLFWSESGVLIFRREHEPLVRVLNGFAFNLLWGISHFVSFVGTVLPCKY